MLLTCGQSKRDVHLITMRAATKYILRTEHLKQAKQRSVQSQTPALLKSNAALAEPLQIPGLRYHEIKITGRPFEIFLLKQLPWLSLL